MSTRLQRHFGHHLTAAAAISRRLTRLCPTFALDFYQPRVPAVKTGRTGPFAADRDHPLGRRWRKAATRPGPRRQAASNAAIITSLQSASRHRPQLVNSRGRRMVTAESPASARHLTTGQS